LWILTAVLTAAGCGYRVVGRANTLPAGAHTIAIPAFTNRTTAYRIEQTLTEAVVREFSCSQTPEKSGFPSAIFGADPERLGLPTAVRGTPGVG